MLKIKIAGERDFEITIKNKNTNFKTLFPDIKINSADEIKMAKYTSWPGSIAPPWINKIWESTDEAYFQRIVDFIESNPVYKNDELSVGGGGCSLKIYMKDGREFRISGSQIIVNGVVYVLEASIPKPEGDPDKYFIDMPTIIIDYVSYGEATKIESAFLNDIQYVKSDKELDYVDFTKDALIDLNGTYISIVSAKEFYFRGELWQVVSDADYTDYLPKAEDETCFITIMDGDAVYKKVLVSKGQKYSAEEINNALSLYRANLYFEDGHVFAETVVTEDLTLNIEFYTY